MVGQNTADDTANDEQTMLLLEGMSCAACVLKVQKALESVPNVHKVQVNLAENTALVSGSGNDQAALVAAVKNIGYGAEVIEDEKVRRERQQELAQKELKSRRWQSILAIVVGFGLMIWGFFDKMSVTPQNQWFWACIGFGVLIVMIITGGHFYVKAWKNLRQKSSTMDTLVSLGTASAWIYSIFVVFHPDFFPAQSRHLYFDAAVMIIGLINFGKMLELKGKQHSSKALERLLDLTPANAIVVTENGEQSMPLSEVKSGMILRLQTGERVPVDGVVTQGAGWLDKSMLTGEPIAEEKQVGDKVSAGTLLTDGSLLFRAEQVGNQTRLANIIKLVRQAQSSKPPIGQLADKVASIFVPTVISIAILAGLIWYYVGPAPHLSYAFVIFTTVLIIACPCALGLATPMSIIAGVGRAAEVGVLVRNADALQKAAKADTLVFDKTGTLTKAEPRITALHCYGRYQENEVIHLAASLEQGASHPLAKAIVQRAEEQQLTLDTLNNFATLKGLGVRGTVNGHQLVLGNHRFMQDEGVNTEQALAVYHEESEHGATVIFFAIDGELAALIVVSDPLRDDSKAAIARLKKQGYHLVMLTGDQEKTAQYIANELGIDEVVAGVLPEGKVQTVEALQRAGRKVVMVGDGINDAPALALADVSIAMGGGSDVAIETAELTLMNPSVNTVADALVLSKGILHNIKENLFGAFVYNIICIPLAAGILYPLWGILINPMWGAAAMALSSSTVVLNANRLLRSNVRRDQ